MGRDHQRLALLLQHIPCKVIKFFWYGTPVTCKMYSVVALGESFSFFRIWRRGAKNTLILFGKPRIYDDIAEKSIAALLSDATGKFVSD